jgi:hypothetical protein
MCGDCPASYTLAQLFLCKIRELHWLLEMKMEAQAALASAAQRQPECQSNAGTFDRSSVHGHALQDTTLKIIGHRRQLQRLQWQLARYRWMLT